MMTMRYLRPSAVAALLLPIAACNTVSGTTRSQLNLLSPAQEERLGDEAYQEMTSAPGVRKLTSGPAYDRVQRIASRIEDASRRLHPRAVRDFDWEWTVIDDDANVNAWALPGGKSAVYTGMLAMAKSDDELAVVMGHEAAHAIAADAGYDPRSAIDLWTRMGQNSGSPPEFLSTHPSEGTRIQRLQRLMPRAMPVYQAAQDAGR